MRIQDQKYLVVLSPDIREYFLKRQQLRTASWWYLYQVDKVCNENNIEKFFHLLCHAYGIPPCEVKYDNHANLVTFVGNPTIQCSHIILRNNTSPQGVLNCFYQYFGYVHSVEGNGEYETRDLSNLPEEHRGLNHPDIFAATYYEQLKLRLWGSSVPTLGQKAKQRRQSKPPILFEPRGRKLEAQGDAQGPRGRSASPRR